MAVYKVLNDFRDIHTKEEYTTDQEIEMTVKRGDEAIKNLKKWDGEFLERIDNKDPDNPPADPPGDNVDEEKDEQVKEEGE